MTRYFHVGVIVSFLMSLLQFWSLDSATLSLLSASIALPMIRGSRKSVKALA